MIAGFDALICTSYAEGLCLPLLESPVRGTACDRSRPSCFARSWETRASSSTRRSRRCCPGNSGLLRPSGSRPGGRPQGSPQYRALEMRLPLQTAAGPCACSETWHRPRPGARMTIRAAHALIGGGAAALSVSTGSRARARRAHQLLTCFGRQSSRCRIRGSPACMAGVPLPWPEFFASYADQGFSLVRLPFKLERLQPDAGAPFAAGELAHLQRAVAAGLSQNMVIVLDPHNYAKRRFSTTTGLRIMRSARPRRPRRTSAEFWARLARLFAHEPRVHFGLMNEPVGLAPERWSDIAQRTILAIRATGARNVIYLPGGGLHGAHTPGARPATRDCRPSRIQSAQSRHRGPPIPRPDSSGTHAEAVSSSNRIRAHRGVSDLGATQRPARVSGRVRCGEG